MPSLSNRSGRLVAVCTALLALAACVTATPYQPNVAGQAVSGGYSEECFEAKRCRVEFAGNTLTSRDRVEGYLLYRAAELTLENGYDWFVIVDRMTERDARTYVEPDFRYSPWYGPAYPYWRPHWRYYRPNVGWRIWHPEWGGAFWTNRVDIRTVERFDAQAEIIMHQGRPPGDGRKAFDARQVVADLEPSIQRPD